MHLASVANYGKLEANWTGSGRGFEREGLGRGAADTVLVHSSRSEARELDVVNLARRVEAVGIGVVLGADAAALGGREPRVHQRGVHLAGGAILLGPGGGIGGSSCRSVAYRGLLGDVGHPRDENSGGRRVRQVHLLDSRRLAQAVVGERQVRGRRAAQAVGSWRGHGLDSTGDRCQEKTSSEEPSSAAGQHWKSWGELWPHQSTPI